MERIDQILKKISSFFYQHIHWKLLVLAIALMVLFIAFVLPREAERSRIFTKSSASADTSLFYTSARLYEIAQEYSPEGISYYIRSRYTFDIAWPIVYMFFLLTALTITFRFLSMNNNFRLLHLFALAAMLFDFIENGLVSIVFYRYPARTPVIAELTPFFTLFKWICIGASFLLLFIGLLWLLIRKISTRIRKKS